MQHHPVFDSAVAEAHSRPALDVPVDHVVLSAVVLIDETKDRTAGLTETLTWADSQGFEHQRDTEQEAVLRRGSETDAAVIKWERHTEFISITIVAPLALREPAHQWLDQLLSAQQDAGSLMSKAVFEVLTAPDNLSAPDQLQQPVALVGPDAPSSRVKIWLNDRAHLLQTSLQHDDQRFVRYRLYTAPGQPDRVGRLVQRLIEIETYRRLAFLSVPLLRDLGARIAQLDGEIDQIAQQSQKVANAEDEARILEALTRLSAQLQSTGSTAAFRFSASQAYATIVSERLDELREERISGFQRLSVAIQRRLRPNIRSCHALEQRIDRGAQRVSYLTDLLRTRVDLTLQEQNAEVLKSIDRRTQDQYRLQKVVETLSVAAISYYAISLVIYFLRGVEEVSATRFYEMSLVGLVPAIFMTIFIVSRLLRKKHLRH
ncbi:MAG: DUF3422 domain-containing protein [Pseudomonadota bacterium]